MDSGLAMHGKHMYQTIEMASFDNHYIERERLMNTSIIIIYVIIIIDLFTNI